MKVLIACEFSGVVRDAFIAKAHDAMSCDLLPTERPGPHVQGDVLSLIKMHKSHIRHAHIYLYQVQDGGKIDRVNKKKQLNFS